MRAACAHVWGGVRVGPTHASPLPLRLLPARTRAAGPSRPTVFRIAQPARDGPRLLGGGCLLLEQQHFRGAVFRFAPKVVRHIRAEQRRFVCPACYWTGPGT